MKQKQSSLSQKSPSRLLPQARELVRLQQAQHYSLVQLQGRLAGLLPRAALDALYAESKINAAEYLTLRLASGASAKQAESDLARAHAGVEELQGPLGPAELREPDLPDYHGPARVARKPRAGGNELRGHPLD